MVINKTPSIAELTILSDSKTINNLGIKIKVNGNLENASSFAIDEMTRRLMAIKEDNNIVRHYIDHIDQKSKETIISSKVDDVSKAVIESMAVDGRVTLNTITETALQNIKSAGYVLEANGNYSIRDLQLISQNGVNVGEKTVSGSEYAFGEMIKAKVIDEVVINNYLEGKPNLLEVDERIINFVSNEISINSLAYSSDVIEYVSNAVATRFGNIRENYFAKVASSLKDIGYGVDQGILHNLMTFESDGKRYSYRQAVDLVNQAEAQGKPIPKFTKRCTQEYFDVKNYLINNYKFSKDDASVAILAIDSNVGACTYASFANEIFASFIGKEAAFENAFGFPMYITVNGVRRFNASQLMADIYVSINSSKYGGRLFNVDAFGNYTINPYVISAQKDLSGRKKIDANFQNYLSGRDASRVKLCSKYLESKGVKYESVNYKYYSGLGSNATLAKFKLDIAKGIRDGKHYSISIHGSKDGFIRLIDPLTGNARVFKGNGGHSMYITGMTNGGFVVSSWGKQYVIPFTDLINGNFNLNSSTFKGSIYENSQFNSNNNTNNNNHLHNNVINFVNNLLNNNNNNGLNPNLTTEEIVERLKSKKFVTPDVISSIGKLDQRSKEIILESKVDNVSKAVLDSMAINGKVRLNAITENALRNIGKYGYTLEVSGYLTDSELKVLSDVDIPVNVNGKVKSSREYTLTETLKKNIVNPTIVKNFLKGNHYGLLYDRDVVSSITREIANNRSLYDSESIRIAAEASVNMFGNERSNFFENFSEYGVDQGALYKLMELDLNGVNYTYSQAQKLINEARQNGRVLPFFQKRCTPEYFDVKEFIMNKYHFSKQDASLVLTAIDNKGACTYASFANEILSHFKGKEKQFEEKFGFPMYTTLPNGVRKLNSSYLMADLYAFINSSENGGVLFNLTYDGRHVVNSNVIGETIDPLRRKLPDSSKQKYLTRHEDGRNKDSIKRYLASKGLNYSSSSVWSQSEIKTMDDVEYFKTKILNDMMNGYQYEISIWASDDQIRMISTEADQPNCFFSNKRGNMKNTRYSTGAHSIYITGVDGDNLIVSSWGHKYKIPFVDLIKGQYVLDRSIIS